MMSDTGTDPHTDTDPADVDDECQSVSSADVSDTEV